MTIRELLGDKFAAKVEEGGNSSYYGVSCSTLDREELLAVIADCGHTIKFHRDSFKSYMDMQKLFRKRR